MPDGDVVYHDIGRGFGGAYNALCEGYFSDEQVARKIAKALRKTLKRYGNQPVQLAVHTAEDISQTLASGVSIDVSQESYMIDQSARELLGHRRGTPLAVDALKSCLMRVVEEDAEVLPKVVVVLQYVKRVLDADFFEHLPLLNHHNDVTSEVIEERLRQVRPYLELEIEHIAGQIARSGSVDHLRKQSNGTASEPDFSQMDIAMPGHGQGGDI